MIVEWYALKALALGLVFGYTIRKSIDNYNKTKCYEIKSFLKRRKL